MRKLFTLCATILGILSLVGCTDDTTIPSGGDVLTPEITLSEVDTTPDSITFKVESNMAGTIGYAVSPDGYKAPAVDTWFTANSKEVSDTTEVTLSGLNDDTNYTLYVIFRAKDSGKLSAPKTLKFSTPDDGVANPITVFNTTYTTITFSIDIQGSYVYQCIDEAYLNYNNITIEEYIQMPGIGINSKGPIEIEWVDGQEFGAYVMHVREDSKYFVVAAITDGSEITDQIYYRETRTPKRPQSNAGLTTELKSVTSTSVTINTTPDSSVASYYVLVRDKAWFDGIVEGYGESMLGQLLKWDTSGAWILTGANEAVWGGLIPETEYICHVLVVDNKGAEALSLIPFTTLAASLPAPKVEASLTVAQENGDTTLHLNLFSEDAHSVRVALNPLADVEELRNDSNYNDAKIVNHEWYSIALSAEQVAAVKSTGLTLKQEDLFPGVEYVAIVSVRNAEKTETIKVMSNTTNDKPVPTRVESDLFTSLLGEWEVSYPLIQFNLVDVNIRNAKVTIAAGADEDTEEYYRSHNRLVIQGWPFNVENDSSFNPDSQPYLSPTDLKESAAYWRDFPALALRDYGPKIFLEIDQNGNITVPSSRGEYLYNWTSDGTFYFFGADLDNEFTAPASFPVTLSEDGNTLTIGACASGAEFGYGVYRPAVFRNITETWALATGDIVLKRVK